MTTDERVDIVAAVLREWVTGIGKTGLTLWGIGRVLGWQTKKVADTLDHMIRTGQIHGAFCGETRLHVWWLRDPYTYGHASGVENMLLDRLAGDMALHTSYNTLYRRTPAVGVRPRTEKFNPTRLDRLRDRATRKLVHLLERRKTKECVVSQVGMH